MGKAKRQSRRLASQRNDPAGLNNFQREKQQKKDSIALASAVSLDGENRYQVHQKEVESNLPNLICGMQNVTDSTKREASYLACAEIFHNPYMLKNVNFVNRLLENGILNCLLKGLSDPQISIQVQASTALRNFTYGVSLLDLSQAHLQNIVSVIEHNFHSNQNDGIQTIITYLIQKSENRTTELFTFHPVNHPSTDSEGNGKGNQELSINPVQEIIENLLNVLYNLFDISEISITHFTQYSLHGNNLIGLNLLFSYLSSSQSSTEILLTVSRLLYVVTDANEILISKLLNFNEGEYVNFLFSILSPTKFNQIMSSSTITTNTTTTVLATFNPMIRLYIVGTLINLRTEITKQQNVSSSFMTRQNIITSLPSASNYKDIMDFDSLIMKCFDECLYYESHWANDTIYSVTDIMIELHKLQFPTRFSSSEIDEYVTVNDFDHQQENKLNPNNIGLNEQNQGKKLNNKQRRQLKRALEEQKGNNPNGNGLIKKKELSPLITQEFNNRLDSIENTWEEKILTLKTTFEILINWLGQITHEEEDEEEEYEDMEEEKDGDMDDLEYSDVEENNIASREAQMYNRGNEIKQLQQEELNNLNSTSKNNMTNDYDQNITIFVLERLSNILRELVLESKLTMTTCISEDSTLLEQPNYEKNNNNNGEVSTSTIKILNGTYQDGQKEESKTGVQVSIHQKEKKDVNEIDENDLITPPYILRSLLALRQRCLLAFNALLLQLPDLETVCSTNQNQYTYSLIWEFLVSIGKAGVEEENKKNFNPQQIYKKDEEPWLGVLTGCLCTLLRRYLDEKKLNGETRMMSPLNITVEDIDTISTMMSVTTSKSFQVRVNSVTILSLIVQVKDDLSIQEKTSLIELISNVFIFSSSHPLTSSTTLTKTIANESHLLVITEAINSIIDIFADDDDEKNHLFQSMGFLQSLKELAPKFTTQINQEGKRLGREEFAFVRETSLNLKRFVKYKESWFKGK